MLAQLNGEVVAVRDEKGHDIAATYSYWFAWQAFHPDTELQLAKVICQRINKYEKTLQF